jgi:hypothetical protein
VTEPLGRGIVLGAADKLFTLAPPAWSKDALSEAVPIAVTGMRTEGAWSGPSGARGVRGMGVGAEDLLVVDRARVAWLPHDPERLFSQPTPDSYTLLAREAVKSVFVDLDQDDVVDVVLTDSIGISGVLLTSTARTLLTLTPFLHQDDPIFDDLATASLDDNSRPDLVVLDNLQGVGRASHIKVLLNLRVEGTNLVPGNTPLIHELGGSYHPDFLATVDVDGDLRHEVLVFSTEGESRCFRFMPITGLVACP